MPDITSPATITLPILETQNLTKSFGVFKAVDDVSISIERGSITGLIGPNGAGKTTLFNTLTGAMKPSAGKVTSNGKDITGLSANRLFENKLAKTFQIPRPFPRMSVLENVLLAPLNQIGETIAGPFFMRNRVRAQEAKNREKALEILEFVTLRKLADHPAGQISGGQMKLLELARVLIGDPELILLDEPAAGVNPTLINILIDRIKELNSRGTSFVIIEHDMDFIMNNCHPIIALAEGQVVFTGSAEDAQKDAGLLEAYLGGAI